MINIYLEPSSLSKWLFIFVSYFFHHFIVLPYPSSHISLFICFFSHSVLHAFIKWSRIENPIHHWCPFSFSTTSGPLSIIIILFLVFFSSPSIYSLPMPNAILPWSFIFIAIFVVHCPSSMPISILKFSVINISELISINPYSGYEIINPLAFIICTVFIPNLAFTISFVIVPETFVPTAPC